MVYTFRLISNEVENFLRDFELLPDQSFFDFHLAIQEELHYDTSQIASFFLCNQNWEKQQEITLFEMAEDESGDMVVMDVARLSDFVVEKKQKILYVFDFFNERGFFIELIDLPGKATGACYPCCVKRQGRPPRQLIMNDNLFDDSYLDEA